MTSDKDMSGRLAAAVHEVGARVRQCSGRKSSIGEENTKAVLIEPIISALGWDLTDLDEVVREYRHKPQDNPVDYALFLHRSPLLFVEAKDLGTNLSDRKWASQVLGYATVVGVEWCVLTDGDEYRIYNAHAPLDIEEKLFHTVRITDGAEGEHTRQTLELLSREQLGENALGRLWKAHFVDRQVQSAVMDLLDGDDSLVRLIKKRGRDLTPLQIRDSLGRANISVDYPAIVETPSGETPRKAKPRRVSSTTPQGAIGLGGETYECIYAKSILIHVANWLVEQGKLGPDDCPVVLTRSGGQGQKRCHVNTNPRHPSGGDFAGPAQLANGLFVETHASRTDLERYARRLLEWAGYPSDMLTVHWSQ